MCINSYTMPQVRFYPLKRKDKNGNLSMNNLPIIAKYSYYGQRLEYYTRENCDYKYFNHGYSKTGKNPIKTNAPGADIINQNLRSIERHIKSIESEAISNGIPITIRHFKDELRKRLRPISESDRMTLTKYFDVYINNLATRTNERTGKKLSDAMAIKYVTIKNLFNDFCKHKHKEYDFDDINMQFNNEFKSYMVTEKNYSVNTMGRSMKFLKTILNDAAKNGYHKNTDFKDILKGVTEDTDAVCLNKEELQNIYFKPKNIKDETT